MQIIYAIMGANWLVPGLAFVHFLLSHGVPNIWYALYGVVLKI